MDFTNFVSFQTEWQFIKDNAGMISLSLCVFVQWIALQALAIHYYLFRQTLKRPQPDQVRFATIEKVISFQSEHLDKIYGKLSYLDREVDKLHVTQSGFTARPQAKGDMPAVGSVEAAYATLGELNFKKRIQEMQAPSTSAH